MYNNPATAILIILIGALCYGGIAVCGFLLIRDIVRNRREGR